MQSQHNDAIQDPFVTHGMSIYFRAQKIAILDAGLWHVVDSAEKKKRRVLAFANSGVYEP